MRLELLLCAAAACGGGTKGQLPDGGPAPVDASVDAFTPPDAAVPPNAFVVITNVTGTVPYIDATDAPTGLVFNNHGRFALCRVGHVPEVNGLDFLPCPSASADGKVTFPVAATAGVTDGAYRADVYYVDHDGLNHVFTTSFYAHRSLDHASTCPANPATFPTDDRLFAEAVKPFSATITSKPAWLDPVTGEGTLPHAIAITVLSETAPFYKMRFRDVTLGSFLRVGTVDDAFNVGLRQLTSAQQAELDLPIWTLRHRISFNAEKTLMLVTRRYESRSSAKFRGAPGLCTIPTTFGGGTRRAQFSCEAIVVNAAGEGFCLTVDNNGPHQAVFSRAMIQKLMAQSVGEQSPNARGDTVWGAKIFARDDSVFADDVYETVSRSSAVILRP